MHDRRIEGKAHVFGNFGKLYLKAMTWWDHETGSVWSQPLGQALKGPYKGTRLEMIPVAVLPWKSWRNEHPDTLVLKVDNRFELTYDPFEFTQDIYVLGVSLGEDAKAYPWPAVSAEVAVNDRLGEVPLLVYANSETRAAHIYVRRAGGRELEFVWRDGALTDVETGSTWDPGIGRAVEGELRGEVLKQVPYATAFDWAWADFYPDTAVYGQ